MAKKKTDDNTIVLTDNDNSIAMAQAIDEIRKMYKGTDAISIGTLDEMYDSLMPSGYISTGDPVLDLVISNRPNGGLPLSKFINIYGDSSVGKSLIVAIFMSEFHKAGGYSLLFDTERASFPPYMEVLGVDKTRTIFVPKTRTLERIFEIIVKYVINNKKRNMNAPFAIIIDSMTATNIEAVMGDLESFGDSGYAGGAKKQKIIGESFQKILDFIKDEKVCFITVDQVRDNMDKKGIYDAKTRSTSGNAQRFYSDIRLEMSLKANIKNSDKEIIGKEVKVKVVKNRIAPSPRETTIFVYSLRGLDKYKSFIEALKKFKIIDSTSHGIKYNRPNGEELRVDGKLLKENEFKKQIRLDKELYDELYEQLYPHYIMKYERKGEDYFESLEEDLIFEEPDAESEED